MSSFNESNTVEAYVRDLLAGPIKAAPANTIQEQQANYGPNSTGIGWHYAAPADVPRLIQEVLVEPWLREALIRLNPKIAAQPDRADEVLYKLRAIVLSVRSDGLIRANEELSGERSMLFGPNNASKGPLSATLRRTRCWSGEHHSPMRGPGAKPADV